MKFFKMIMVFIIALSLTATISGSVTAVKDKTYTYSDILSFLKQKIVVDGKDCSISNSYIVKAERFFKTHKLTSSQCEEILVRLKEVLEIMKSEGMVDLSKMSWQAEHRILRLIYEGAEIVGITVKYGKSGQGKGYLEFYEKNGTMIDAIYDAGKVFKYTGQ